MPLPTLKVTHGSTTRRMPLTSMLSFANLETLIKQRFGLIDKFVVTYLDRDGDLITVSSDIEVVEFLEGWEGEVIRVVLYQEGELEEVVRKMEREKMVVGESLKWLEGFLGGFMEVLSAMCFGGGKGRVKKVDIEDSEVEGEVEGEVEVEGEEEGDEDGRIGSREDDAKSESSMVVEKGNGCRCGRDLGYGACCGGLEMERGEFGVNLRLNEETKAEVKGFLCYLYKSPDRELVLGSAKETIPVLRKWMVGEVGEGKVPGEEDVEVLVGNVNKVVGGEFRGIIGGLLRVLLKDEVVVAVLRRLKEVWGIGEKKEECSRWKGFDVHFGTVCVNCDMKPIVGSRFMEVSRENFNLCGDCYAKSDIAQNEMQFRECRYVWESVLPGYFTPPARLEVGDQGPRVKFLHKVLMDAGVMTSDIYPGRLGFFGENTKMAVKRFQAQQNLGLECEQGVYDEITADRLLDIVEGGVERNGDLMDDDPGDMMD